MDSVKQLDFYEELFANPYYMDGIHFVWGVRSTDLYSSNPPNLLSANDIDIEYDEETKKYYLSIEQIYQFEGVEEERGYLLYLFKKFSDWMGKQDYNPNLTPVLFKQIDFRWEGENYYIEKDSVEELYAEFKWSVENYCLGGEMNTNS